MQRRDFDVIVVGGGNAALSAALAAREAGAQVLVIERAPQELRGGNTYFTGGLFRFAFATPEQVYLLIPDLSESAKASVELEPYPAPAYYDDMMRVTEGRADPQLVEVLIAESLPTMQWLREKGVRWLLALGRQAFKVGDKFRFYGNLVVEAVGGGRGLSEMQFAAAESANIPVRYESRAIGLLTNKRGHVTGLRVRTPAGDEELSSAAAVLACGGFEANPEMRARYLGPDWDLVKVRGTPHNTGDGHRMALEIGAQPYGHWSGAHACAWDYGAPPFGDRKLTDLYQKHSYPFAIVVNARGQRFVDEGADFRNYTYAKYGREILKQPGQLAFQIFDQRTVPLQRDEYHIKEVTKATANSIEELAVALGIDRDGLVETVRAFNASVQPGEFSPTRLDGKATRGITPPKSNWALPIDTPPYEGYAVTCGITFTFGGVRIDRKAQVLDTDGRPIPGLYAAGEVVGGLFYHNYPGGAGLMAGAVFGRIAGRSAALSASFAR